MTLARQELADIGPKLVEVSQILAEIGPRELTEFVQVWPISPNLVELVSNLAQVAHMLAAIGRTWVDIA